MALNFELRHNPPKHGCGSYLIAHTTQFRARGQSTNAAGNWHLRVGQATHSLAYVEKYLNNRMFVEAISKVSMHCAGGLVECRQYCRQFVDTSSLVNTPRLRARPTLQARQRPESHMPKLSEMDRYSSSHLPCQWTCWKLLWRSSKLELKRTPILSKGSFS